jgi:predicted nucleic acid-binding protein
VILVDADVILDVALDRTPHVAYSAALLERLERGPVRGFVAWHTLSNLYYLLRPTTGAGDARLFLNALVGFLTVAPASTDAFRFAAALSMPDLEDAMQAAAAWSCGARVIATRNTRDFTSSPIPALTPEEALQELGGR